MAKKFALHNINHFYIHLSTIKTIKSSLDAVPYISTNGFQQNMPLTALYAVKCKQTIKKVESCEVELTAIQFYSPIAIFRSSWNHDFNLISGCEATQPIISSGANLLLRNARVCAAHHDGVCV